MSKKPRISGRNQGGRTAGGSIAHLRRDPVGQILARNNVNPDLSEQEARAMMAAMQAEVDRKASLVDDYFDPRSRTQLLSAELAAEFGLDEATDVRPAVARMLESLANARIHRLGRILFPSVDGEGS